LKKILPGLALLLGAVQLILLAGVLGALEAPPYRLDEFRERFPATKDWGAARIILGLAEQSKQDPAAAARWIGYRTPGKRVACVMSGVYLWRLAWVMLGDDETRIANANADVTLAEHFCARGGP
jgi:hypothetical protein